MAEFLRTLFCSQCPFSTRFFDLLVKHYVVEHNNGPQFRITCGIKECPRVYSKVYSVRKHFYRKHRNISSLSIPNITPIDEPVASSSTITQNCVSDNGNLSNSPTSCRSISMQTVTPNSSTHQHMINFLLHLREKLNVSQKASVEIVEEFHELLHACLEETRDLMDDELSIEQTSKFLKPMTSLISTIQDFNSEFKQRQWFEKAGYIAPMEIKLPNGTTYMYVPIIDQIKAQLSHDDVMAYILEPHVSKNDSIKSFTDGSSCKHNTLLSCPTSIQVNLYCDDMQIVNPIGNRTKFHKTTAFYFVIGNIPSHLRSKLYCIQLVLLIPSIELKKQGHKQVLAPLIKDLLELEKGIMIPSKYGNVTIKGTVAMLIADNLAAHEIGGYLESFSCVRPCRFCDVTRTRLGNFSQSEFQLRTVTSYNERVANLESNSQLSTVYGLKRNSVLNQLQYYHVCWGSPSDFAHDILEGFGPDLIKVLIDHCTEQNYFSLEDFNFTLSNFEYVGHDRVNKPAPLVILSKNKCSVKQTAMQCLCLLQLLPLMISHHIPVEDEHWFLYTEFLHVMNYILAPSLNEEEITYMEFIISLFFSDYFKLPHTGNATPKVHYICHYATQYKTFGPIVNQSTLRFEGKHAYFKKIMKCTKNFVNPCKTMAVRHQYLQCFHHQSICYLQENEHDFGKKARVIDTMSLDPEIKSTVKNVLDLFPQVTASSYLKYQGITYDKNTAVLLSYKDDYVFGRIQQIFLANKIYLLIKKYTTLYFSLHMHAYVLKPSQEMEIILLSELLSPVSVPVYSTSDQSIDIVIMRHHVQSKMQK